MSISPINSNPQLRLVNAADAVRPAKAIEPTQPTQRTSKARQFDDVLEKQGQGVTAVPRVSLIEAQRRLEKIRKIIAAQTKVPINFEPSPGAARSQAHGAANPYRPAYLKFPISPADQNAGATDRAADG